MPKRTRNLTSKQLDSLGYHASSDGSKKSWPYFPYRESHEIDSPLDPQKQALLDLLPLLPLILTEEELDVLELREVAGWSFPALKGILHHECPASTSRAYQNIRTRARALLLTTLRAHDLITMQGASAFTIHVGTAEVVEPRDEWAVSLASHERRFKDPQPEDIIRFLRENEKKLMSEGQVVTYFGFWLDSYKENDHEFVFDLTRLYPMVSVALQHARANRQQCIYNLKTGDTVYVSSPQRKAA